MKWALFLTVSCLLPSTSPLPAYQPPYGEKLNPKPFRYEYGVQWAGQGTAFNKEETQDEEGNVFGSVVVSLPDGRIQTTNYNADFYDGYHADVKYAGTAHHPSEHHQTYDRQNWTPVHLQSRPIFTPTSLKPNQGLYRQYSPIKTRPNNSPFRHHQQPLLQQQFKSVETIIPGPVDTAHARPEKVIFQSDQIKPVMVPAESSRSQAQNNDKLQQNSMVEIMKNIREDLKKENKPLISIPNNSDNTMFLKTNINNSNAIAQDMKKKMHLNIIKSNVNSHKKSQEQIFPPRPLSPSNADKMEEIMQNIREDLKKSGEVNKSVLQPNLKTNVPSLKVEEMTTFPSSLSAVAPSSIEISSEPKGIAEIMKQVRQDLKYLNKEPAITPKSNPRLEEAKTSISMAQTIQNIRNDLKTSEKVTKSPNTAFQSQTLGPTKADKMKKIMKNIRDKLKETEQMSKPLTQTKLKTQEKTFKAAKLSPISGPPDSVTKSMSEIMKKIREDLKNINKDPTIIPQSNIKFVETNKNPSDSKEMREELQSFKLINTPTRSQNTMLQKRPLVPTKPDTMAEIMTKIREDLKKNEAIKPPRLPSVNPETPPLMTIKSHIIPGPEIKENLSAVMSIKSPAAEKLAEMMEKIRQDLTRQETSSDGSDGMMGIVMNIRKDLGKEGDSKYPPGMAIIYKESSTNNHLTDSVVDFMEKVELMKEKQTKLPINTMLVKTTLIKHENSDLDVLPRILPNSEESINQVRY